MMEFMKSKSKTVLLVLTTLLFIIFYFLFFQKHNLTISDQSITATTKGEYDVVVCTFDVNINPESIENIDSSIQDEELSKFIKEYQVSIITAIYKSIYETNYETLNTSVIAVHIAYNKLDLDIYEYLLRNPKLINIIITTKNNKKYTVKLNSFFNLDHSPKYIPSWNP